MGKIFILVGKTVLRPECKISYHGEKGLKFDTSLNVETLLNKISREQAMITRCKGSIFFQ